MTKKLRKPLSIILSLMMILSALTIIPMTAFAASSGSNGGFNWAIDDDGNMTVTGSGELPRSFIDQNGDIKSIVFDEACQVTKLNQYSIFLLTTLQLLS